MKPCGDQIYFVLYSVLLALLLNSCDAEQAPYPLLDSGFGASKERVAWLDEHRVLFYGYGGQKPQTQEDRKKQDWGIYIWDIGKNTVSKYADARALQCYRDGRISYWVDTKIKSENGKKVEYYYWKSGEFGKEKAHVARWRDVKEGLPGLYRTLPCRAVPSPKEMQGKSWEPLLEGNGYLEYPSAMRDGRRVSMPAILHRPGKASVALPFSRYQIGGVRYYDFAHAYFTEISYQYSNRQSPESWTEDSCWPFWWFTPEGNSKEVCVPYGPWAEGASAGIVPAKAGLFIWSMNTAGSYGAGKAGGYLLKGGKWERVVVGPLWGPSVSPGGCVIAFAHAPHLAATRVGHPGQRTVKAIDLCKLTQEVKHE